ncbi:uncharacterized protein [Coffea arabica]|uniref:Uncharacterized protein isoform X3 n=1 Tax=Coffea arabica TaxID=13443 RepID=A0ABM4VJ40_COFAR
MRRVKMESCQPATTQVPQQAQPQIQIYGSSNGEISPFWREKYERDAKKYWDIFYKRHQDKFFKDRHYLDKEWGHYFSGAGRKVILEVGCGVGNTIFPLVARYPDIFIHACDFSPRAVNLVKKHKEFNEGQINAFVCDLTVDDLSEQIPPSSVDAVTMIFVLSAVSPEKMSIVLQNIRKVLKVGKYYFLFDIKLWSHKYDFFEVTLWLVFLVSQVVACCFVTMQRVTLLRKDSLAKNRRSVRTSMLGVMALRWVQAVFRMNGDDDDNLSCVETEQVKPQVKDLIPKIATNGLEVDISDGLACEMFGIESSSEEIIEVIIRDHMFKIKVLSREHQHTCKSTGLMLWESARLMASVLAANATIVAGKRVLELGCGCGGICSMLATGSADLVVATDGDAKALELLTQNVASNLKASSSGRLITKRLEWGNEDDIESVKELNGKGFDVIIGTDVTYVREAISPLFQTAKELIAASQENEEDRRPALILCHLPRRVDEPCILAAASEYGFKLVDRLPKQNARSSPQSIISSWFHEDGYEDYFPTKALSIMYFTT